MIVCVYFQMWPNVHPLKLCQSSFNSIYDQLACPHRVSISWAIIHFLASTSKRNNMALRLGGPSFHLLPLHSNDNFFYWRSISFLPLGKVWVHLIPHNFHMWKKLRECFLWGVLSRMLSTQYCARYEEVRNIERKQPILWRISPF